MKRDSEPECPPPTSARAREEADKRPFRLGRPTAMARHLRNNANEIEGALWQRLRRSQLGGFKFSRQIPTAGAYPDFICRRLKLVVELDGSQHADATAYDARRTRRLEQQGCTVLRFWNSDVLTNMDGVLETILAACERLAESPPPTPSRAREGARIAASPPPASGRGLKGGLTVSPTAPLADPERPPPTPSRAREGARIAASPPPASGRELGGGLTVSPTAPPADPERPPPTLSRLREGGTQT